eukprot:m.377470 g.377470  ORF g.377470 m.377470 type:complete len:1639 (+) comp28205_c0_seq3:258-5174(+)
MSMPGWKRDLLERRQRDGRSWYAGRGSEDNVELVREDGHGSPTRRSGSSPRASSCTPSTPAPKVAAPFASAPSTPMRSTHRASTPLAASAAASYSNSTPASPAHRDRGSPSSPAGRGSSGTPSGSGSSPTTPSKPPIPKKTMKASSPAHRRGTPSSPTTPSKPPTPSKMKAQALWMKSATAANPGLTITPSKVDVWAETLTRWEDEKKRLREESKRIECELYISELAGWLSALFDEEILPSAFFDRIWDGVLLCALAGRITDEELRWAEETVAQGGEMAVLDKVKKLRKPRSVPARRLDAVAWDNINQYCKWCRSFGLPDAIVFESPAVHARDRTVLVCLMETARRAHIDVVPQLVAEERQIEAEAELEDESAAERERELEEKRIAEEIAEQARLEEEKRRIQEAMEKEAAMLEELRLLEERQREQRLEEDQLEAMILESEREALSEKLRADQAARDEQVVHDDVKHRRRSIELAASKATDEREEAKRAELQRHQLRQLKLEAEREAARREAELVTAAELAATEVEARRAAEAARREREEMARVADEQAERDRLETAMRGAKNEQAAARAAQDLQRAKDDAEQRRSERKAEEEQRCEREAAEAVERAKYASALAARRRELAVELDGLLAEFNRLTTAIEDLESERAQARAVFFGDYQAAVQEGDEARKAVDAAKQRTGDIELLILQEKLGEKEEVQRILTAQKAETEAAHSRCQNKLRELAEHEQVLANARAMLANLKAQRMGAQAEVYKSKMDEEVQNMVKSSGAGVELVRLREGTYLVGGTTRKLFIRILNTNIMVRVGGGWETLKSWLSKHGAHLMKSNPSARGAGSDVATITVGRQTFVSSAHGDNIKLKSNTPDNSVPMRQAAEARTKAKVLDAKTLLVEERRAAAAVEELEIAMGIQGGRSAQAAAAEANIAHIKLVEAAHSATLVAHKDQFEQRLVELAAVAETHTSEAEAAAAAIEEAAVNVQALEVSEEAAQLETTTQQQTLAELLGAAEAKSAALQSELSSLVAMERSASLMRHGSNSAHGSRVNLLDLSTEDVPENTTPSTLDGPDGEAVVEPACTAVAEANVEVDDSADVHHEHDQHATCAETDLAADLPDIPPIDDDDGNTTYDDHHHQLHATDPEHDALSRLQTPQPDGPVEEGLVNMTDQLLREDDFTPVDAELPEVTLSDDYDDEGESATESANELPDVPVSDDEGREDEPPHPLQVEVALAATDDGCVPTVVEGGDDYASGRHPATDATRGDGERPHMQVPPEVEVGDSADDSPPPASPSNSPPASPPDSPPASPPPPEPSNEQAAVRTNVGGRSLLPPVLGEGAIISVPARVSEDHARTSSDSLPPTPRASGPVSGRPDDELPALPRPSVLDTVPEATLPLPASDATAATAPVTPTRPTSFGSARTAATTPRVFDHTADSKWFGVKLGLATDDIPVYESLWAQAVPTGTSLHPAGAKDFFELCGLPKYTLKQIWATSDVAEPRGRLGRDEFFTACKLIAAAQAGMPLTPESVIARGVPLPSFGNTLDEAHGETVAVGNPAPPTPTAGTPERVTDAPVADNSQLPEANGNGDTQHTVDAGVESLAGFLRRCAVFEKAWPVLETNEIEDVATLRLLSKADLVSLGLKLGTVAKILQGLSDTG